MNRSEKAGEEKWLILFRDTDAGIDHFDLSVPIFRLGQNFDLPAR